MTGHSRGPCSTGLRRARVRAPMAAALLCLLALPSGSPHAQVLAMVSPTQAQITVKPNEGSSRDVTVSNLGATPVRVRVRLSDWTLSERGEIGLAALGTTAGTLQGALQFSPAEFALASGESRRIQVTANLPGAGPATRWGMLLCQVRSQAAASDEIGPRAATELGTTLFVSSIPPDDVHAEIIGLTAAALGPDSIQITARVRNTGLRQIVVSGEAALADSGGVRLGGGTMTSGLVMPGASRYFQWTGHARFAPGGCLATATLDGGEPELLVGETRFVPPGAGAPTAEKTP